MFILQSDVVHVYFFFFQAEDGIRDLTVTGVQTCALPISRGQGGVHGVRSRRPRRLVRPRAAPGHSTVGLRFEPAAVGGSGPAAALARREVGRAAGRGRGEISGGGVSLKKKKRKKKVRDTR